MMPGDRRAKKCRRCGRSILLILSRRLRPIPCESLPSPVDGAKTLVFANGEIGTRYTDHEIGHEIHSAHCTGPRAPSEHRGKNRSGKRGEASEERAVDIGCGCLGGAA